MLESYKPKSLDIISEPDPRLKMVSEDVVDLNDDIRMSLQDMRHTMYEHRGIGIAGVQVGIMKKMIVIDIDSYELHLAKEENRGAEMLHDGVPLFMINPRIIKSSEDMRVMDEGCLSVYDISAKVRRPKEVTVRYISYDGAEVEKTFNKEPIAACVQHEIDHINGITFIDRLSKLKRDFLRKKIARIAKF